MKALTLAAVLVALGPVIAALGRLFQPQRRRTGRAGGSDGGGDFSFASHDGGACDSGAGDASCGDGGGGDGGGGD